MTIDELISIMGALMNAKQYRLAEIVRAELVARQVARDAVLDYIEGQDA